MPRKSMDERALTDEELEELRAEALDQLADAVHEYNEAKHLHGLQKPNLELATRRFNTAKDSLRLSIQIHDTMRQKIIDRYKGGNPV
jgi:hypothetical protein